MQFFRRLKPIQALSFDLDDTLYDNVPVMQRAEHAVRDFMAQQFPITQAWTTQDWVSLRIRLMHQDSRLASDMTLLRLTALASGLRYFGVGNDEAEQGATAAMAHFMRYRNDVHIPQPVHRLLAELAQKYTLIAISNGNVDVTKIGLGDYFQLVLQPGDGRRGKPFTDLFDAAHAQFPTIAAEQWLHIGDSTTADVLGAHRAGWQSAWFTGGLGFSDQLQSLPTFAFHTLEDLGELLLRPAK